MKGRIFTILAATCCMSLFSAETYGQYPSVPVTISKEKTRMNGKVYYTHVVLEKQTLYSISKAYGVSIQDIYAANPSLQQEGLKKNAIILIPAAETAALPSEESADSAKESVTDAEGPEDNAPEERKSDRKKKDRQKRKKEQDDGNFVIHTVKWYEDLDMISEKYGVPVETIMQVNGLSGRKLTNRQKLKVPADLKAYMEAQAPETDTETEISSGAEEGDGKTTAPAGNVTGYLFPKNRVNVALMLPFNAKEGTGSENNMDFYSGALLAARALGKEGTGIDLSVYDTGGGSLPITAERLAASDVVIGPVSTGDLGKVLAMAPEETAVVSPLDPRAEVLLQSHPNLIQVPAASGAQYADLISWIGEEHGVSDRTIVIFEKGLRENGDAANVNSLLQESGLVYSSFSYSILEGRNVLESMETLMDSGEVNRVLLVSESEAFVNDVVRNLNLMRHDKYRIVLYGTSRIRNFETINVDDLHNTDLHMSLSYHVDYERPEVKDFLMKYRALYNTEPGAFAFQGYDILHYFVKMCAGYGKEWKERLEDADTAHMLQSDFKFRRSGNGGYENTGMRRIIYCPDYTIRPAE